MDNQQIENARGADLVTYFQRRGYTTKTIGNEIYIKDIAGLCINAKTNQWYYHYEEVGGSNAINCLEKMLGMSFKQAVEELASPTYSLRTFEKPKTFSKGNKLENLRMPQQNTDERRVFAYMIKTRKIPEKIIQHFVKEKMLYQDTKGNAIFVRRDGEGNIIGGEVHGTVSNKRYKQEVGGDGRTFKFQIGDTPTQAFVFESAIDLMSFYAIFGQERLNNSVLVSMAGLKPSALEELKVQGLKIFGCTDNQKDGKEFCQRNGLESVMTPLEKNNVKDWNDLLVYQTTGIRGYSELQEQNQHQSQQTGQNVQISEIEDENISYAKRH